MTASTAPTVPVTASTTPSDDASVRRLVDIFAEGWNAARGETLAQAFAPDADFTNVMGLHAKGRDLIARGHDEILATVFRNTRVTPTVDRVRFLRSDVAVLDATFTLTHLDGRLFEMGPAGHSKAELVATKEQGTWSIAVFRNMIPFVRPLAGPLERSIANADRV